jgi:deazaflavin-dependent oxidoreductase (nitroreductase family)
MQIPRAVATFNKHVNNRIQGLWAGALPPWLIVLHDGRRSGRAYRTPVLGFLDGDRLYVPLLYGEQSDWARNLLAAGGGRVRRRRRVHEVREPHIVPAADVPLTGFAGRYTRSAPSAMVMRVGPSG